MGVSGDPIRLATAGQPRPTAAQAPKGRAGTASVASPGVGRGSAGAAAVLRAPASAEAEAATRSGCRHRSSGAGSEHAFRPCKRRDKPGKEDTASAGAPTGRVKLGFLLGRRDRSGSDGSPPPDRPVVSADRAASAGRRRRRNRPRHALSSRPAQAPPRHGRRRHSLRRRPVSPSPARSRCGCRADRRRAARARRAWRRSWSTA